MDSWDRNLEIGRRVIARFEAMSDADMAALYERVARGNAILSAFTPQPHQPTMARKTGSE